ILPPIRSVANPALPGLVRSRAGSLYHLGSSLARRLQPDTALPDLSIEFHLEAFRGRACNHSCLSSLGLGQRVLVLVATR
ncbi:hypothetical protein TIFTF001_055455, partial [Ficus carica]